MANERCRGKCTQGRDCQCDGTVKHSLHICRDPLCACHGPDRYGVVLSYAPQPQPVVRVVNDGELREVAA